MNISAVAFQRGKAEDIKTAYKIILNDLKNTKYHYDLEYLFRGAEKYLDDLSESIIGGEELFKSHYNANLGVLHSPNLTTYVELINRIEYFYRGLVNTTASLVFDSSRQFNAAFANWFYSIVKSQAEDIHIFDKTPIIFGYDHLKDFSNSDSKSVILLQTADIVASSINHLFKKILYSDNSTQYSYYETFLIGLIYQFINDRFGDWIITRNTMHKYVSVFISEGNKLRNRNEFNGA